MTLPIELVAEILSFAQNDDCLPSYKWLRRCALVCKAWCPYAQSLLFRRVVLLNGVTQCQRFTMTLSGRLSRDAEHTSFLCRCVKTLVIGMDHQDVYIDAILLCPNLFELNVKLFHAMFRAESLRKLINAPRYQALHIRSTFFTPMKQLLELSPAVQYLAIDVRSMPLAINRSVQRLALQQNLRELRIFCLPSVTSMAISWILPTQESRQVLEVLHISEAPASQIPTPDQFQALRALHVRSITTSELLLFPNLEELALHDEPPSEATIRSLPCTLRHLLLPSLAECYPEVLRGLVAYEDTSGGTLSALTYTRSSSSGPAVEEDDVQALRSFCQTHRIQFYFMDPPYGIIKGEVSCLR